MLYVVARYCLQREGRFVRCGVGPGMEIDDAVHEAVALAKRLECGIEFDFCGIFMWVYPSDDPVQRAAYWHTRYADGTVTQWKERGCGMGERNASV